MSNFGTGWSTERIDLLKKLFADGLSASEIAAEIGGLTRNAVIGKVHRLGLNRDGAPRIGRAKPYTRRSPEDVQRARRLGQTQRRARESAEEHDREPEAMDLAPDLISATAVTLVDLHTGMCRWPHGDPADLATFRYCGDPSREHGPYCPRHSRMAYQKPAPRPPATALRQIGRGAAA